MDDFIAKVFMNNETKPCELLTFANTPEEAIDNVVQIETAEFLCHIIRVKDGVIWDFDQELGPLRKIRKMVFQTNDVEMEIRIQNQGN